MKGAIQRTSARSSLPLLFADSRVKAERSSTTHSGTRNLSGSTCASSGTMITVAPKPVMPNTT